MASLVRRLMLASFFQSAINRGCILHPLSYFGLSVGERRKPFSVAEYLQNDYSAICLYVSQRSLYSCSSLA